MNLADKPCYPQPEILILTAKKETPQEYIGNYMGLTFRERLVIALASNPSMVKSMEIPADYEYYAIRVKNQADATIKEMGNGNRENYDVTKAIEECYTKLEPYIKEEYLENGRIPDTINKILTELLMEKR